MRFVVDEASWNLEGHQLDEVTQVLEGFIERLDVARSRTEVVGCSKDIYEFYVTSELRIYQILFEETYLVSDRDMQRRLIVALDRLSYWDDDDEQIALEVLRDPLIYHLNYNS